ncbi:TetR/AcrR family transcriptional regulator [Mucilaginibacter conchicola]|uniref:TetR/AcrR family transcriptional regulator n=1 Tax=Mucilaginibacter conchicola TaxID=2303333 RepID=A0A372NY30_9SPHI|nr:TetR/AcrR family transcriptional regulator [Mucilaginibacter conchicola]RFZ94804.1 TetR/AcrR family transcriptional regulator [Mucilaginibacter conchicola]
MARSVEFDEEQAIQKAMEVFWEKGYNGASLRDLTEAMQINSSSLYNTIGDKKELFLRSVQRYADDRRKDSKRRLESGKSAFDILIEYINDAVDVIIAKKNGCMAVKMAFEVGNTDKRVADVLKADSDFAFSFLRDLIKSAMKEGRISADEEPELLADYFNSTWTGWYESYILHKDGDKIRRMAQFFIKQISK